MSASALPRRRVPATRSAPAAARGPGRSDRALERALLLAVAATGCRRAVLWQLDPDDGAAVTARPRAVVVAGEPPRALAPGTPGWPRPSRAVTRWLAGAAGPDRTAGRPGRAGADTRCVALAGSAPVAGLVLEGSSGGELEEVAVAAVAEAATRGPGTGPAGHGDLLVALAATAAAAAPETAVAAGCRRLAAALGASRASVFVGDRRRAATVLVSAAGGPPDAPPLPAVPDPLLLVERVLRCGHPEQADVDSGLVSDAWRRAGVGAALAVPLGDHGVLLVDVAGQRVFADDEVVLAGAVAALLALPVRALRREAPRDGADGSTAALRELLEQGVRASSPLEAAEALAGAAARVLELPVACAYLVDRNRVITEVVSVGAPPHRATALRDGLVGQRAEESPVWRRTVDGDDAGPDLISDTAAAGRVRVGGVAELLGLRSMVAIPLLSSDGPLGLVLSGDPRPGRRWREGDRELLAQLALEGAVVVDNARLREAERYEARHDPLTGLVNRRAFNEELAEAVANRPGTPVAALLLDLDGFKEVNDRCGHHCGDELLVAVAERLSGCVRGADVVGRIGGDEFAVLLAGDDRPAAVVATARRIDAAVRAPFLLSDGAHRVRASIGIARRSDGDVAALLREADQTMYAAKRAGGGYRYSRRRGRGSPATVGVPVRAAGGAAVPAGTGGSVAAARRRTG